MESIIIVQDFASPFFFFFFFFFMCVYIKDIGARSSLIDIRFYSWWNILSLTTDDDDLFTVKSSTEASLLNRNQRGCGLTREAIIFYGDPRLSSTLPDSASLDTKLFQINGYTCRTSAPSAATPLPVHPHLIPVRYNYQW